MKEKKQQIKVDEKTLYSSCQDKSSICLKKNGKLRFAGNLERKSSNCELFSSHCPAVLNRAQTANTAKGRARRFDLVPSWLKINAYRTMVCTDPDPSFLPGVRVMPWLAQTKRFNNPRGE
jgi:hypothetical protein